MTIREDNPAFEAAIQAYRDKRWDDLKEFMIPRKSVEKVIARVSAGLEIDGNRVIFEGREVQNFVVERILTLIKNGYNSDPLINFLQRLMKNPSYQAIHSLYQFLENKNLPITDRGTFIAYKSVKPNYTDCYSGKYNNKVGESPLMPRNECDDNTRVECSRGFHIGSYQYAYSHNNIPGRHLMLVECDPADVVSVPSDGREGKLRTCTYLVIGELVPGMQALDMPVFQKKDYGRYPAPSAETTPGVSTTPPIASNSPISTPPKVEVESTVPVFKTGTPNIAPVVNEKPAETKKTEPKQKETSDGEWVATDDKKLEQELEVGQWAIIRDRGGLTTNLKQQLMIPEIGNSDQHRSYRKKAKLTVTVCGTEAIAELNHRIQQNGFHKVSK